MSSSSVAGQLSTEAVDYPVTSCPNALPRRDHVGLPKNVAFDAERLFDERSLYAALAEVSPSRLPELLATVEGLPPGERLDVPGPANLTPLGALVVAAGPWVQAKPEQNLPLDLVGRAWTWLAMPPSRRTRSEVYGCVELQPDRQLQREAAHQVVMAELIGMAIEPVNHPAPAEESSAPRRVADGAVRLIGVHHADRIEVAKRLRHLLAGPASLEMLGALSRPDAGLLFSNDAVLELSDAGVVGLELLLGHVHDAGGYVINWCRPALLKGVDEGQRWNQVLDQLTTIPDTGDGRGDLELELEMMSVQSRSLEQLKRLIVQRGMLGRVQSDALAASGSGRSRRRL